MNRDNALLLCAAVVLRTAFAFVPPSTPTSITTPPRIRQSNGCPNREGVKSITPRPGAVGGAGRSIMEGRRRNMQLNSTGSDDDEAEALERLRQEKLTEWRRMISSGQMAEEVQRALDDDVTLQEVEEEEDASFVSRRGKRKARSKGTKGLITDADVMPPKPKPPKPLPDWRDVQLIPGDELHEFEDKDLVKKNSKQKATSSEEKTPNELAAQLAAGVGFSVVPTRGLAGEAGGQEEEQEGEEEGEGAVQACMRAIRKEEKKGRNAEKVMALLLTSVERDGVREDSLFTFAIKSLARLGKLDLSLRVEEMRDE
ncbi:unnamed protein product [Choristocarpus tenellus]